VGVDVIRHFVQTFTFEILKPWFTKRQELNNLRVIELKDTKSVTESAELHM
jgi:hypothetical protein